MRKYISFLLLFGTSVTFAQTEVQEIPVSLNDVYAPVRVAAAPSDAYIGLSLLPTGELRHYNYGEQADAGCFYLQSMDKGLSWKKVNISPQMPYADVQSPVSGEFLRLTNMRGEGVYCIRTVGGIHGDRTVRKVSSTNSIMLKPPVFIRGGKRIIVAGHGDVKPKGCYVYYSDDDGLNWKRSQIVTSPDHVKSGSHKGVRWNHGAVEPTVVELRDGRLWMLMRTSQDFHYESFSSDGGETWSESRPSIFYGTITMPTMGRLSDGRLLMFWSSTTPLPELATADGVWDDVFTNRDVIHVAISEDDGKTWIGCRELMLNPLRNEADFGSGNDGVDRSVHQSQFVEVAPGKICVAIGQHRSLRSIILFDVKWLYEKGRSNDFSDGLAKWSVFNYKQGIVGHCAYDRIEGCSLVEHPDLSGKKVLQVRYTRNIGLVDDNRGALWNFPTMQKGHLTVRMRIPADSQGVSLMLNDHWYNPCDTVALHESMYVLKIDRKRLGVKDDSFHDVMLKWNLRGKQKQATVWVDGKKRLNLPLLNETALGINYVHILAEAPKENEGVFIECVNSSVDD